jgi:hypothetical protein
VIVTAQSPVTSAAALAAETHSIRRVPNITSRVLITYPLFVFTNGFTAAETANGSPSLITH